MNELNPNQVAWAIWAMKNHLKLLPVHGIRDTGLCTCGHLACNSAGKHPMSNGWQESMELATEQGIRQFWQYNPSANFGIRTKGMVVIDVDSKSGGLQNFEKYILPHLKGVRTLTVLTGSGCGSKHIYLQDNTNLLKGEIGLYDGIDLRTAGNFVVAPGSKHKSGTYYSVLDCGTDTGHLLIADLSEKLRDVLVQQSHFRKNVLNGADLNSSFKEGSRNSSLMSEAGKLRKKGLSEPEIETLLRGLNEKYCKPPLKTEEIKNIAKSVCRYPEGSSVKWSEPNLVFAIKDVSFNDIDDELIPYSFKEYVLKKAKSLGVPKSAIMASLLTLISSILGAAFKIKPSRDSDYGETLNLWGLIIAPPSSRKTSVLNISTSSMKIIDDFFSSQRLAAEVKRNDEMAICKAELSEKSIDKIRKQELEINLAKLRNTKIPQWAFFTSDTTAEALALLFKYNHRGILLFKDELEGLLSTMSKQGYEALRSLLNEGWNGARPHRITRVERGIIDIDSVTLSILGGIQPDVLANNFKEELRRGAGGDGFLARFQLVSIYGSKDISEPDLSLNLDIETKKVSEILIALHEITKLFNLNGYMPNAPLVLSDSAQKLFSAYQKRLQVIAKNEDIDNQAYKSHVGKFGRLVLSLAGQFHLVECILLGNLNFNRPVDEKLIQLAIRWAMYMEKQVQLLYFNISKNTSAKALVAKIKNGDITDKMSVRSIYRHQWSGLQHKDDVLAAIETINDANWVSLANEAPSNGGRDTELLRINPKLVSFLKMKKSFLDATDVTVAD